MYDPAKMTLPDGKHKQISGVVVTKLIANARQYIIYVYYFITYMFYLKKILNLINMTDLTQSGFFE